MDIALQQAMGFAPPRNHPLLPWEEDGWLGIILGGREVSPMPSFMEWVGPAPTVPGSHAREPDDLTDVEEVEESSRVGKGALAAMDRRKTTGVSLKDVGDVKKKRALLRWLRIGEENLT